ncbi:hypothetical protein chiPu_0004328 [Chiloscyllium punctatum]|uniref:Uncharacterized protein n=1 Tax=Chiloscyllium punctatum TaxID=137246 RepID=A0A401S690_CHIPU|nr:hypothetical protein [Chiloscyllium punctatum]
MGSSGRGRWLQGAGGTRPGEWAGLAVEREVDEESEQVSGRGKRKERGRASECQSARVTGTRGAGEKTFNRPRSASRRRRVRVRSHPAAVAAAAPECL